MKEAYIRFNGRSTREEVSWIQIVEIVIVVILRKRVFKVRDGG